MIRQENRLHDSEKENILWQHQLLVNERIKLNKMIDKLEYDIHTKGYDKEKD